MTHSFSFHTSRYHPPARRLLKALSFKQGMKYDDPESAKEIPTFIEFHGINVDELLDPLDSFSEFSPLLSFTSLSLAFLIK